MNLKIPHHLQRQLALVISKLQNAVDCEATKAYLTLLSLILLNQLTANPIGTSTAWTDSALPTKPLTVEETQMTLLNEHCMMTSSPTLTYRDYTVG